MKYYLYWISEGGKTWRLAYSHREGIHRDGYSRYQYALELMVDYPYQPQEEVDIEGFVIVGLTGKPPLKMTVEGENEVD